MWICWYRWNIIMLYYVCLNSFSGLQRHPSKVGKRTSLGQSQNPHLLVYDPRQVTFKTMLHLVYKGEAMGPGVELPCGSLSSVGLLISIVSSLTLIDLQQLTGGVLARALGFSLCQRCCFPLKHSSHVDRLYGDRSLIFPCDVDF